MPPEQLKLITRKKALQFIGLTFLLTYLYAFLYYISGGRLSGTSGLIIAIIYMYIPMTIAIVLQKYVNKKPLKALGISFKPNKWFLAAWLIPLALAFLTLAISLLLPGIQFSPAMEGMFERFEGLLTPGQIQEMKNQFAASPIHPIYIAVAQGLIAGITINAVAAFGEELGWRGYLQKQLEYLSFWKSSLAIGIIWGFWHAPLIIQGYNYPQHPIAGVFMMTVFTTLLSPIFSYVRIKARSVIAAAIIHGTLNATYGISIMLIKGGNDLTTGIMGIPGFIALVIINLAILFYDRKIAKESITSTASLKNLPE